jgi:ubiquinone/menaquinone biosynthesis C-methylase UbiE
VGIDRDEEALSYAEKRHRSSRLKFIVGDAQKMDFPDRSFEVVVSLETIEHLSHPKKFLEEAARVLKPQGVLVLSTPDKKVGAEILIDTSYQNPFHKREFALEEIKTLLSPSFAIEKTYGQFIYQPSSVRTLLRNALRVLYKLDRQKTIKKILPLSLILRLPRFVSGVKGSPEIKPLAKGKKAQINILVCQKKRR